ncbi:MAG: MGMT family protein [Planctomycetes bacterium]|nr:MGMT family protein [Planctomycetota bacterium]
MVDAVPWNERMHGPRRIVGPGFHERVHALVRTVPAGAVVTYGDLARALGSPNVARHVGFAMAAVPAGSDVPWWRVVAAGGRIATASASAQKAQAKLLAREGLAVRNGRVLAFAARRWPIPG